MSMKPGAMALAVMPRLPTSAASARVKLAMPPLAVRVGDRVGLAALAHDRADVEDPPPARAHQRQQGHGAGDGPGQVDAQHMLEALERQRVDPGHVEDRRVVDQDVQSAQAVADEVGQPRDRCLVGDVDLGRDDRLPRAADAQRLGGGRRPVDVGHHHDRALAGEPLGDREADAAGGAGDDGVAAGEWLARRHGQLSRTSSGGIDGSARARMVPG